MITYTTSTDGLVVQPAVEYQAVDDDRHDMPGDGNGELGTTTDDRDELTARDAEATSDDAEDGINQSSESTRISI